MRGELKGIALMAVGSAMFISSMVLPTTSIWMEGGVGPHGNIQHPHSTFPLWLFCTLFIGGIAVIAVGFALLVLTVRRRGKREGPFRFLRSNCTRTLGSAQKLG